MKPRNIVRTSLALVALATITWGATSAMGEDVGTSEQLIEPAGIEIAALSDTSLGHISASELDRIRLLFPTEETQIGSLDRSDVGGVEDSRVLFDTFEWNIAVVPLAAGGHDGVCMATQRFQKPGLVACFHDFASSHVQAANGWDHGVALVRGLAQDDVASLTVTTDADTTFDVELRNNAFAWSGAAADTGMPVKLTVTLRNGNTLVHELPQRA